MGTWRDVMTRADAAKRTMLQDRAAGRTEFQLLLRDRPNDGMIFFKRGEAHEAIGERLLAAEDYQRAEQLFPRQEWKARARQARLRLQGPG